MIRAGRATAGWSHQATLVAPTGFPALVSVGVGPDGLPIGLWTAAADSGALQERVDRGPDLPMFARTRPTRPPAAAVTRHTATGAVDTVHRLAEVTVSFPLVQPLPDGGFVLVGARAAWRPEGAEHNAIRYTSAGDVHATGCIGDGISQLQTDARGRLWAGYYDEGVYGNFGWGGPSGPTPLGAPGIVAWSTEFTIERAFESEDAIVDDCYTLNVAADEVWACTYSDFPIIRMTEAASIVTPTSGLQGPRGIITDGERVALLGAYRDPDLCTLGRLIDGRYVETSRVGLRGRDRSAPGPAWPHCRGPVAHFFSGSDWSVLNLADLPDGQGAAGVAR